MENSREGEEYNNEPNYGLYSNPRLFAVTAYLFSENGEEEEIEQDSDLKTEVTIEYLLNEIMGAIYTKVGKIARYNAGKEPLDLEYDYEYYVTVSFNDETGLDVKTEVIDRLCDLGYVVYNSVATEEEQEYLKEIQEMSKTDPSLKPIIDEYFYSNNNFIVRWDIDEEDGDI